jgi:hypothetical protein
MTLLFFGALSIIGCGYERFQKRLDNQEFDHYYALRVYMTEDVRKTYLKIKIREDRDAYLKDRGLWERFYKYEADNSSIVLNYSQMVVFLFGSQILRQFIRQQSYLFAKLS